MTTKPFKLLAMGAVLASVAACATTKPPIAPQLANVNPDAKTPLDTYQPRAEPLSQEVSFAIHPQGLSLTQQAALGEVVARWKTSGGGDLTVRTPADSADPALSRRMADAICAFLQQLGVPLALIHLTGYATVGAVGAPVVVAYKTLSPVVGDCSTAWDSLTATKTNAPYRTFGCAEESNIAMMVADPNDLRAPASETPGDNARRQTILAKYRQGQTTSSATDTQASGKVSGQ